MAMEVGGIRADMLADEESKALLCRLEYLEKLIANVTDTGLKEYSNTIAAKNLPFEAVQSIFRHEYANECSDGMLLVSLASALADADESFQDIAVGIQATLKYEGPERIVFAPRGAIAAFLRAANTDNVGRMNQALAAADFEIDNEITLQEEFNGETELVYISRRARSIFG
jgi:hypothetical protein